MIADFALRLIAGLSLTWVLAPRKEITSGFFRIQMLVTLGLAVLSAMIFAGSSAEEAGPGSGWLLAGAILLAMASFVGSVMWTLERRQAGTGFAVAIAVVSMLLVAFFSGGSGHALRVPRILNGISSAWLIGGTTAAMLLGHWYLTATGMSLMPLIRLNQLSLTAVIVRAGVVAWLWSMQGLPEDNGLLLSLRVAGLAGPLVLGGLVIQILRYRNTQSATGVLYAATILVFMGEMADALLNSPVRDG